MGLPLPILVAAVIVLMAGVVTERCFAAAASSQLEVTVQVKAHCELSGTCALADVHELNEPGHVPAPLAQRLVSADNRASVTQLPASGGLAGGSRIMVRGAGDLTRDPEIEVDF